MRPRQLAASPLYPKIRFAFTDHHGVGGSDLTAPVLRTDRLRAALAPWLAPFTKTSNNQIPAVDMLLAWWYGFALGAERFEHMTRYSRDPLLPRLLGLPRFPSPTRSGGSFRATRTCLGHQCALCRGIRHADVRERPDSENRIKELKEELSLDTFCLQLFDATAAAFEPAVSATTC